ncbi:hypothetical protein Q73_14645 [Bacillus coahuilensis m2-6]|uniref:Helix-turn-helix conjugative transposon-like domain-containing protein n=1 Tax=Bacillus coahuilensis p1.1.43 TaxID=1150625 RepID=A0A147KCQ6_9BACI|nr:hypothetical protein [Bacillus coahuilensis]KUP04858.1 hypothetical protein Q73_14645 [Bacillus coahuilensis m2-6]KUP09478.1 hypothetical protein Q75_00745 [Bacillus coahuilensis p1.1.43]
MVDKQILLEELMVELRPSIRKALQQTPPEHRKDLEQELYLKMLKKVKEENVEDLPSFFDMMKR